MIPFLTLWLGCLYIVLDLCERAEVMEHSE